MAQDQSLETIIRDLRGGKDREKNCRLLFVRFYSQVCRYFQGKGFSAEDSQDLGQDVFYLVFKNLGELRDEAHFPGWLFRISQNVFNNEIDRRGAKKRAAAIATYASEDEERDILAAVDSSHPEANVLKGLLNREKVRALARELHKLPDQMRRCVYLRVVHEYSDDQIATLLNISNSTVRVQVHRARKTLSEALRPVFGDLRI